MGMSTCLAIGFCLRQPEAVPQPGADVRPQPFFGSVRVHHTTCDVQRRTRNAPPYRLCISTISRNCPFSRFEQSERLLSECAGNAVTECPWGLGGGVGGARPFIQGQQARPAQAQASGRSRQDYTYGDIRFRYFCPSTMKSALENSSSVSKS